MKFSRRILISRLANHLYGEFPMTSIIALTLNTAMNQDRRHLLLTDGKLSFHQKFSRIRHLSTNQNRIARKLLTGKYCNKIVGTVFA